MLQTVNVNKDVAIGIAITSILIAASIYIPIVGFFCMLFIPLPAIFYRSKLGRANGIVVPALSTIVIILLSGGISVEILFFVELLLLGFVLSELFELNLSIEKTILYASCAVLLTGFFILLFYSNKSNIEIIAMVSEYMTTNLESTIVLYENLGLPEKNVLEISAAIENIQYILLRIIPSMAVMTILFFAWTSLLLARPILKAKNLFYPDFGSLKLWKAPEFLVWGVVGCGLAILFPDKGIKSFAANGLLILMTVYFFEGIAIVSFFFEKKGFPRTLRFFLYSLIALQQFVLFFVIGLGFFDIWLNLRKLEVKKS